MTSVCLGVGCERQSKVRFGLAQKPLLLFRYRGGVRAEKGKAVESIAKQQTIQLSRLRLVDALPRFVEPLQGKGVIGESLVGIYVVRCKAHGLRRDLRSFFILPLCAVYDAQIDISWDIPRVALNRLLIRRCCFIQFSGYILVVVGGDSQLFPFAGMFPQ